ncbi:metallophosphoesterase [Eupransor demetentiae]|uniref:3 n=1 Tax=Eupransor demetentiae TaxID=3109584 RepID=A0ABP0ETC6_9LACO|nr:3' [Lactobacillaceae bacterium LMG 33000]
MKVAFSSDNHFDLNKVDLADVLPRQADYLLELGLDAYIINGDLFNDFNRSLKYARQLQEAVGNNLAIRFLAGNHDMGSGVTYEELESDLDPLYFHHKSLDLGNYRILGNNGWYDYAFDEGRHPMTEIERFKHEFWYDRRIEQPMSDPERMALAANQVAEQIKAAGQRKTILVNHFVPKIDFIRAIPNRNTRFEILNAFLGSPRFGDLAQANQVQAVIFGHLHRHPKPLSAGKTTYYSAAVGYNTHRVHEWTGTDFFKEWQERLVVLDDQNLAEAGEA